MAVYEGMKTLSTQPSGRAVALEYPNYSSTEE